MGLQHSFMAGDHRGILLHDPLFLLLTSSRCTRIRWLCPGGFYMISHPVTHINDSQYACFQSLFCPLMTTIPEFVHAGSVPAGFFQEGRIKGKDAFPLLQGTVEGLKDGCKGQWPAKLVPDSFLTVPAIAAQG